nr:immunoglobulin light chain junction region [Macaca mulatta]
CLQYRSSPFTF